MLETFLEILLDAGKDTLKLLPFLFATYLLMEFIEHKTSEKNEHFRKYFHHGFNVYSRCGYRFNGGFTRHSNIIFTNYSKFLFIFSNLCVIMAQ